jgi:hypothetical protein
VGCCARWPQAQWSDPSTGTLHAGAVFWINPLGLDNRGAEAYREVPHIGTIPMWGS